VKGQATAVGTPSLTANAVSYVWTNNVLGGGAGFPYPSITWLPAMVDYQASFTSDYRLVPGSPYVGAATDAKDVGVIWGATAMPVLLSPSSLRIVK